MKQAPSLLGLCVLQLFFAAACGGEKTESPAPAEPPAASPATEPEPAPAAAAPQAAAEAVALSPDEGGVVRVTANDQMRYNGSRIEVKAGDKIKIELKNVGSLPKEAMGHNLVVLKPGTDPMAYAAKATSAKASDFIPEEGKDDIIAHTKLLGPGESETIEFEVPGPGTYPFVCTFPGHAALMKGELVVSE